MQPFAFLTSELFPFQGTTLFAKLAFSKSTWWVRQIRDESHRWPSTLLIIFLAQNPHPDLLKQVLTINFNNWRSLYETTLDAANSSLSSALTFYPTVVFSRLCCLWWTISDVLIAAVGTNYCMQIWARCHFWAASLCRCCQFVVSLLKRHFTVSESACDENPLLELRNYFCGMMLLSKIQALMSA